MANIQTSSPASKPAPQSKGQQRFLHNSRVSEPKSAPTGEFVEMVSRKPYNGFYIKGYKGTYYAGKTVEENGVELEKVRTETPGLGTPAQQSLAASLLSYFKKIITAGEILRGIARRFFIQDKKNNKILETDKQTYLQAKKETPNRRFAEIDWIIKGPSEDKVINTYKYEGAESRNKKTIQDLEKQMPGISLYVTNYKEFVQEPVIVQPLVTYTETQEDSQTSLENSRKANFDQKI